MDWSGYERSGYGLEETGRLRLSFVIHIIDKYLNPVLHVGGGRTRWLTILRRKKSKN